MSHEGSQEREQAEQDYDRLREWVYLDQNNFQARLKRAEQATRTLFERDQSVLDAIQTFFDQERPSAMAQIAKSRAQGNNEAAGQIEIAINQKMVLMGQRLKLIVEVLKISD